jgi:putative Mg2+ transporter-C (MgtC) family protein
MDIGARLAWTFVAGGLIGANREARGHAAGLRTTMLVCLAASVAMIQGNLLLPVAGRDPSGFGTMDLMRMPLGILTGMGFIGGGAILRHGNLVMGVTTAATLWMATVIGLCFGGGQWMLGAAATGLTLLILWVMKLADERLPKLRRATMSLTVAADGSVPDLTSADLGVSRLTLQDRQWLVGEKRQVSHYDVRFRGPEDVLVERVGRLAHDTGVFAVKLSTQSLD